MSKESIKLLNNIIDFVDECKTRFIHSREPIVAINYIDDHLKLLLEHEELKEKRQCTCTCCNHAKPN